MHSGRWQIQILRNAGYTVGYSPKARLPLWVFFRLDTHHPLFPLYRRPHIEFFPDDRVSDPVYSSEYSRSGYQRGHMATSATIGIYFGSSAQSETFRLTNVVPQVGWNNEGIWNTLERIECDDYPKRYGVTESVCGPVLGSQRIGRILVPRALYKIIERPDGKCLPFIIPQDGPEIPPSDLAHELTSVAQIEEVTGLVFDFVPESQKQTVPVGCGDQGREIIRPRSRKVALNIRGGQQPDILCRKVDAHVPELASLLVKLGRHRMWLDFRGEARSQPLRADLSVPKDLPGWVPTLQKTSKRA